MRAVVRILSSLNNDLGVGIFGDGSIVLSGPAGLTISTDRTCTNPVPSGPIGGRWFADVTVDGQRTTSGLAVSRGPQGKDCGGAELFESLDAGRTWSKLSDLPSGFCPLTVDSAPSDVLRVYVSGNVLGADGLRLEGQILVSDDRGATWTARAVPDEPRPFIGAIDPTDRDTIYVRTSDPPATGRLLVSNDGAKNYRTIATLTGVPLQFFGVSGIALSPDGRKLAYGSLNEGLFVIEGKDGAPEKRSSIPVMCLAWTADGLYACSAPNLCGPFLVGVSRDDGCSFDTLVPTLDIGGDWTTCASGTAGAELHHGVGRHEEAVRRLPRCGCSGGRRAGRRRRDAPDAEARVRLSLRRQLHERRRMGEPSCVSAHDPFGRVQVRTRHVLPKVGLGRVEV